MDSGSPRVAQTMNTDYYYEEEDELDEEIIYLMKKKRQVQNKRSY